MECQRDGVISALDPVMQACGGYGLIKRKSSVAILALIQTVLLLETAYNWGDVFNSAPPPA